MPRARRGRHNLGGEAPGGEHRRDGLQSRTRRPELFPQPSFMENRKTQVVPKPLRSLARLLNAATRSHRAMMIFPCMLACCARPAAGLVAPALRFSKPSVATRRSLRDAGRRVAPPTMRAPWQKFAAAPGALAPRALQGGRDPRSLGEAARRAARRALAARMLEPVISQRSDSSESISTSPRLGRSGAASAPVAASSWPRRQRDSRVLAAAAPPRPVVLSRSDRVGVVSRARPRDG